LRNALFWVITQQGVVIYYHRRRELDGISWEMLEIHMHLAGALSERDWILTDRLSFEKASHTGENSKTRQSNKFLCLHRAQRPVLPASQGTVLNLARQTAG